jgi:ribosome maturation factor RimP
MRYDAGARGASGSDVSKAAVEEILKGLGLYLIDLSVSRHKGSVNVRVVIYRPDQAVGHEDCSRAHHALKPGLDMAFGGQDVSLEVSSPGINRNIRDGREMSNYTGREINCYRVDISDWSEGVLEKADEEGIVLKNGKETLALKYEVIAKARLK